MMLAVILRIVALTVSSIGTRANFDFRFCCRVNDGLVEQLCSLYGGAQCDTFPASLTWTMNICTGPYRHHLGDKPAHYDSIDSNCCSLVKALSAAPSQIRRFRS